MAYDYIEQKPEFYDYYNNNPKLNFKQKLIFGGIVILISMLLIVGSDIYHYFRQISFWNNNIKKYEVTKDLSGFEITNAAYKCVFTETDFVKLDDGVYLELTDHNFKNSNQHIADVIVSPKTVLSPERQLDEATNEYFHPYIDVREYFDIWYCCNDAADGLPEFKLNDGTTGKLNTLDQEVFMLLNFATDKRTWYNYRLYIFN